MQSQVFGVNANAARAAKRYGLTRGDLIAVSGGWCFNIPSETAPARDESRARRRSLKGCS
jgi:hypothetical protein